MVGKQTWGNIYNSKVTNRRVGVNVMRLNNICAYSRYLKPLEVIVGSNCKKTWGRAIDE